ncbi:DUF3325 domain-containing protein [Lysobacter arvi]|uniref:DUF3325 domain-containing protein n=1 Tax=Lysobacter arvi TaxID=3038776 RepID=A0ABU1CA39_9GAMM|nr:DUF3325 domain-containing protein [Lysobacter arvi]MDR0182059.1 DUF3325 domain-containing protein [Lysobacter arvi]
MSEPMLSSLLLAAAFVAALAGMGWLALAMPSHAQQVWGEVPPARIARALRGLGASGLVTALALCLAADHASMASLVWVMTLATSALVVAFALSTRPAWLRGLAPWVRIATKSAAS